MPSFWSSISSSSKNPPLKGKSKSSNDIFKNSGSNNQNRKLTRQRKLRYVTDDEVGLKSTPNSLVGSQSLPVSPDAGSGARTPHHVDCGHWSKSAVPLPLPLPLPLPEVNPPQFKQKENSRDPPLTRNPIHQTLGETTDNVDGRSYISSNYRRRRFPQELNVDTAQNDFRLHFPARSAPGSGYSSPILSPQRYSTVDLFHPSFQVSSVLDTGSTSERLSKSYQLPPMPTPDYSTPHGNSRNCNGVFLHSHNKSFPESSAPWTDNNANVHPLPRPPNVSRPSFNIDRPEISSVKGQWQRGRPIGRGTYGSVYIATHRETGATCAVKEVEMIPDDPKCVECIKQLEQEMKFLRELKHPNIVQYYGCEIIEDRFCIYLEYVHPGSINKYVNEHCGAMTESIVRNFTRHIVSGLAYLHSTKTIHRDIKGPNLLVNASGVVKLADFGLAKHLAGNNTDLSLKGTPHWMAPEVLQAAMRKDSNPELAFGIDIWSVGCTVIEMLTGKPPWSECNWVQAMFSVLNEAPFVPETLSSEGKDFLQLCFQRRPADRPSASKLLEHPFLRSSHDQNTGAFVQELSETNPPDAQSPGDWTRRKRDVMPLSSVTRIHLGKLSLNSSGETSRQSSDIGVNSHHSPRSTLEDLHGIPSPELNRCSNGSSPSKVQNNLFSKVANNNIYSLSCKGNFNHVIPKIAERKNQSCNVYQKTE